MEFWSYSLWIFVWVTRGLTFNRNGEYVTVSTTNGNIMGIKKDVLGKPVYVFLGIPYAKPPVGRLRFRNPELVNKWEGTYSATKLPKTCYQNLPEHYELNNPAWRIWTNNTEMSEDCLYLSIWTPKINKNQNRKMFNEKFIISTLVWIHGGGFTGGSSTLDIYNGEILASKMNVIVVNIQYRLGPFGFLSYNVKEIPGNQGLMDQVLALQWIRDNIGFFGGDSKLVTIFGANSGAVSASFHLLSPLTQDLFNQAIMQSGSALSWWAYDDPKTAISKAYHFANLSGCHNSKETVEIKTSDLFECLRSLDPITLVVNQWKMLNERYREKLTKPILPYASFYFDIPFKPTIGGLYLPKPPSSYFAGKEPKILRKRVMLGTTKNEGLIHLFKGFRHYFMPSDDSLVQPALFRYGPNTKDPADLLAHYIVNDKFVNHFNIEAIAFEYELPSKIFQQSNWKSQDIINVFDNIAGDFSFKCPVVDFADKYLKIAQVYLYSFEQQTQFLPLPPWSGVLQGQEIAYVFGKPFDMEFRKKYYNFSEEEMKLSEKIMSYWTNFAQTGQPNNRMREYHTRTRGMHWDTYSGTNINGRKHLIFRNNRVLAGRNFRRHECLFWRNYLPDMRKNILSNSKCNPRTNTVQKPIVKNPTYTSIQNSSPLIDRPIAKSSKRNPNDDKNNKSTIIGIENLLFISIIWIFQMLKYLF